MSAEAGIQVEKTGFRIKSGMTLIINSSVRQYIRKKRSLDIMEKVYGPDHPDVARDLDIMAALYRETNREEAAVELEKRAADIRAIKR